MNNKNLGGCCCLLFFMFFALQHLFACRACCPSRWHRLFEPATSWHPGNRAGWLPWIPVNQKCNSAGVDNLQKFQKNVWPTWIYSFISLTHQNKTQYPILSPFDGLPKWVVIWWLYPDGSHYITSSYSTYIPFFPMASASGFRNPPKNNAYSYKRFPQVVDFWKISQKHSAKSMFRPFFLVNFHVLIVFGRFSTMNPLDVVTRLTTLARPRKAMACSGVSPRSFAGHVGDVGDMASARSRASANWKQRAEMAGVLCRDIYPPIYV